MAPHLQAIFDLQESLSGWMRYGRPKGDTEVGRMALRQIELIEGLITYRTDLMAADRLAVSEDQGLVQRFGDDMSRCGCTAD